MSWLQKGSSNFLICTLNKHNKAKHNRPQKDAGWTSLSLGLCWRALCNSTKLIAEEKEMSKRILPRFLTSIVLALLLNTLVAAQSLSPIIALRDSNALPTIMVVGTTHFASPGQDNINFDVEDVLFDAQQASIIELVDALAEFRPTHVVVEVLEQRQSQLDER